MPHKNSSTRAVLLFSLLIVLLFWGSKFFYAELVEWLPAELSPKNKNSNDVTFSANNEQKTASIVEDKPLFPLKTALEKPISSVKCAVPELSASTAEKLMVTDDYGVQTTRIIKSYYRLQNIKAANDAFSQTPFITELNQKLFHVFSVIENTFNTNLSKKITLNMAFHSSRLEYEEYLMALGVSAEGTQGVYLYPQHIAVIEIKNYEQGIQTAIHEAIHAFNQSYWGHTLRFFNEGMAKYFQHVEKNGYFSPFDFSPLKDQQFPMQIETLLFSDTDWHGENNQRLYQNSHALFHFLMNDKQGRTLIWAIMQKEKVDPCTVLSQNTIEEMLFDIFPNHQQAFDYWFADGVADYLSNEVN